MIALLEEVATQGQSQGSGITLWANIEWALEDFPGVHDILKYEARVNYVLFCKPNCKPTTRPQNGIGHHKLGSSVWKWRTRTHA
jgi:hypothetical protein